ncbi:MAG: Asp-tRNA(Asn)/Glu-tRNA(Gln) amidotransferase subunit GatA [Candidatus Nezhaarchaeota archaeon]|nr:Asp-tRNA(Asn)/Glu-tRNA(Gln) amidotransferase subunit GatA [Candidatus Nezhaarchaeota archaeon]
MSKLVSEGSIEAVEIVEACFNRIERLDGKIHAFLRTFKERALREAEKVGKLVRRGISPGRLAGVPIAVKDNICVKGVEVTCASNILRGYRPPYNATVIERLGREGAIVIGMTNMDEFAMGSSTENSAYGPTRNPWSLDRVPGGSSGGSAAAVAARMAPLALGSDTGGSIRCPASFCSVVGVKPTYGLVSRYGLIAYACSLEQIGPLARTVRDAALLLEVIAGHDPMDATTVEPQGRLKAEEIVGDVRGLKLAVPRELMSEGCDPRVLKSTWRAIYLLEELGATYEEVSIPSLKYALAAYYVIAMSEASSNLARYDGVRYGHRARAQGDWSSICAKTRREGFGEEVRRRIILGTFTLSAGYYGRYYLKALKVRTLVRNDLLSILSKFDAMVSPTMPTPPFRIGEKVLDPLSMYLMDVNTVPMNLAGVPAVSVPCDFVDGLPVGLQITSAFFREDLMFRVAMAIEEELKLYLKEPPGAV